MSIKKSLISIILLLSLTATFLYIPGFAAERKPFKKHTLPGYIVAADFDDGDEGVTYSPLSVAKTGTYNYRPGYDLNFWQGGAEGQKTDVAMSFNTGEWTTYTVNVSEDGEYEAVVDYATPAGASQFNLYVDGNLAASEYLDTTGSFQTRSEQSVGKFKLTAGVHIIKFEMVSGGMNFDGVSFTNLSAKSAVSNPQSGSYRYVQIPSIIEAEDYDYGENGSHSSDNNNAGKKYRKDDPMDIFSQKEAYFVRFSKDESTSYTFDVLNSGIYDLYANAYTQGKASIYFDDSKNAVQTDIKTDGSRILSVYLEKGTHTMKFTTQTAIDVDYFRFMDSIEESYITIDELNKENVVIEADDKRENIYKEFFVSVDGSDENDGTFDAPFKTVAKAKDAVKSVSPDMTGDIIVNIMPGYYYTSETIKFDESDSGKNGHQIIWKGYNALEKPVIGGGKRITGWEKQQNGIYKTTAPDFSDLRTLYIDGFIGKRAASKYCYKMTGFTDAYDGMILDKRNFPKLLKPENAETVWELYWLVLHIPLKNAIYSQNDVQLLFDSEPWGRNNIKGNKDTMASEKGMFHIENDLSLLDEFGEWYFDKDTKEIYYFPFPEEDMETVQIYGSDLETLMTIQGDTNIDRIENVSFKNISFKHSDYISANTEGIIANQDNQFVTSETGSDLGGNITPAQIQINNAKNINFTGCEFKNFGSGALSMINSVSECEVIGNIFSDLGGSSIIMGSFNHKNEMPDGIDRTMNIEFANNVIRRTSANVKGSCGVSVYYTSGINIVHNDIKETPYSGITMGWGWGAEDIVATGNHNISYNRVEDVMQITTDGGHIYTLGPLRDTNITGNYCIDSRDANGGIYLDQGTAYVNVTNNVIRDTTLWFNARANAGLFKVTADNNYTDTKNENIGPDAVVINTHFYSTDSIPDEAQSIINNAGLEKQYKNLLSGIERPEWRTNLNMMSPDDSFIGGGIVQEAEHYMEGGQGVGHYKVDGKNVRITAGLNYQPLSYTAAGEWLNYEIDVKKAGEFTVQVRYSNQFPDPTSRTRLYIDGKIVAEGDCPRTKSWNDYAIVDIGKAYVSEGYHIMKIEFVDNAHSFDWWRLYDPSTENVSGDDPYYDEGVIILPSEKKEFKDIKGHWAEQNINTLASNGIIKGVTETEFAPEIPVTLYQASWLILRTLKVPYDENNWQQTAYSLGLISGLNEADSEISRERFASITANAYMNLKDKFKFDYDKNPFNDLSAISEEYQQSVINAYALGLVKGDTNKNFNPKKSLTRAEAATVILTLYQLNN